MEEICKAVEDAVGWLDSKEQSYGEVRALSEHIVRECGKAVQLIHAGEMNKAADMLQSIKDDVSKLSKINAPNVQVAQQEYAEAIVLHYIMSKKPIPHYSDIHVNPDAYLLGLSDVIGELRREIIEFLRKDNYNRASELFSVMSDMYENLLPIRYSNSILPGYRRKLDVSRSMVEQCRRDLLMFKISKNL